MASVNSKKVASVRRVRETLSETVRCAVRLDAKISMDKRLNYFNMGTIPAPPSLRTAGDVLDWMAGDLLRWSDALGVMIAAGTVEPDMLRGVAFDLHYRWQVAIRALKTGRVPAVDDETAEDPMQWVRAADAVMRAFKEDAEVGAETVRLLFAAARRGGVLDGPAAVAESA